MRLINSFIIINFLLNVIKSASYHQLSYLADIPNRSKNTTSLNHARIAIVLPYFGDTLPAWFDTFAMTVDSSNNMIDWLLFVTESTPRKVIKE